MNVNMKDEYRRSMDALRFTDWQKDHLVRMAVQQSTPTVRRRFRGRTLVALTCIIVLLVSAAGASGLLRSAAETFIPIFGPKHNDFIEKVGQSIGVSSADNGVTITVDAILGDRYSACVVYSIQRDDGTPMLPEGVSLQRLDCGWGGAMLGSGSHGTAYFMDQDPADPAIQYVELLTASESLEKCTVSASFRDLFYWDEDMVRHILAEGSWSMRFDLNYEDSAVCISGGETFTQHDMTYTIEEIRISPLSLHVFYSVDQELKWNNDERSLMPESESRKMARYFERIDILLTKADGTIIDMTNAGGSISPEKGETHCMKGTLFEEIIPLEEIVSVRIGGVEYLLPVGE